MSINIMFPSFRASQGLWEEIAFSSEIMRLSSHKRRFTDAMETIYANKNYHDKEQAALMRKSITLCPDYDYCLENERQCPIDMEDLRDKQGLPIAMPELEEWQREICGLIVDVNVGEEVAFDWEDYHKRGIELAKRLRERLSTEYDLWYEAPAEDQSGTIKERILIL